MSIDRSIDVSLVTRCTVPERLIATISAIARKNSSFSSGVPMVTRKQSARRGQPEQSRIRMLRSSNSCHTCAAGLGARPEEDEVGAARHHVERHGGRASRTHARVR